MGHRLLFRVLVSAILVTTASMVLAQTWTFPFAPLPTTPLTAHASTIQTRTQTMLQRWSWPDAAWRNLAKRANRGRLFEAALMYLAKGNPTHLTSARQALLRFAERGGDLGKRALNADDAFFQQGQPWLGDIYYKIDPRPFLAYLWIYPALNNTDREKIEAGFLTSARFRMRAMTRWSHTPNLIFKPTVMVAMAGLVTGDQELLQWGFYRGLGSRRGGYFSVLNSMLVDKGPWHEAPLYPIAHRSLAMMLEMSRLLTLGDGKQWFSREVRNGGSPRGLLDYFIDSAYPPEPLGEGRSQIRIASYGDGATGPGGDLFLLSPEPAWLNLHQELALAYALSAAPRYAAFLQRLESYQSTIPDQPPLPETTSLPPAPSRLWPDFGLAMLRSVESSDYWREPGAIAASMILSQGYGHEHADKFSITLHGAGRLLYPDYNAVQYENQAKGWTRTSVAHNTLVVDGKDTRNVEPESVRHEFGPSVKFLAATASEVFEAVTQTRALFLTREYLLDLFHAESSVPRTYDYLLHSFGRPETPDPEAYRSSDALGDRYWNLSNARQLDTDAAWSLDFVIDEAISRRKEALDLAWWTERRTKKTPPALPVGWFEHRAAVRVTMASAPNTQVSHGETTQGLSMLVARRSARPETLFSVVHEPYAGTTEPQVDALRTLVQNSDAVLVKVQGRQFTDYVAVALDTDGNRLHTLQADDGTTVSFRNYGYLRVHPDGTSETQGHWMAVPPMGHLSIDSQQMPAIGEADTQSSSTPPDSGVEITVIPEVIRLAARDQRDLRVQLHNASDRQVTVAGLSLDLPAGLKMSSDAPLSTVLAPGETHSLPLSLLARNPGEGLHLIPLRLTLGGSKTTQLHGLKVAIGPTLEALYRHPESPVFRIHAPRFTADLDMRTGALLSLIDDTETNRISGQPLFTIADETKTLMDLDTDHAFTWPREVSANVLAQAQDRLRWQTLAFHDRLMIRLNPHWTQFPSATFTLFSTDIGNWKPVAMLDAEGGSLPVSGPDIAKSLEVMAVKLRHKTGSESACLQLMPPTEISITDIGLRFTLRVQHDDRWTIGPCEERELMDWIWR